MLTNNKTLTYKLLQKGKIKIPDFNIESKGRLYSSNFEVSSFEEFQIATSINTKESNFFYDFMAKHEKNFKNECKKIISNSMPNYLELIKDFERVESPHTQGSEEWHLERLSFLTSTSSFEDSTVYRIVGARIAKALKESRDSELISMSNDIISTMYDPNAFVSRGMKRGNDLEKKARELFEKERGVKVEEKGLITIKDESLDIAGTSVDGIFTINGKTVVTEFKSPSYPKFLDPNNYKNYIQQCAIHRIISNADEVLLVEYYPRHKLKIKKLEFEDEYLNSLVEKMHDMKLRVDELLNEKLEEILGF